MNFLIYVIVGLISSFEAQIVSLDDAVPVEIKEDTMSADLKVTRKSIEDVLIASVRFVGDVAEIPSVLDNILVVAGEKVDGKPLVLFYPSYELGDDDDVEVCVPVSDSVETDTIKTRLLEGGEFLTTVYYGADEANVDAAWNGLFAYINEKGIKVKSPAREVYLELNKEEPEKNVTELQYMLLD